MIYNHILILTYRRLENMAKKLEFVDQHLENLAEVASLLNIIAKFGGKTYSRKITSD